MISVQGEEAVSTNGLRGSMAHAQEWRIQARADSKNDPKNSRVTTRTMKSPLATRVAAATWALENLAKKTWAVRSLLTMRTGAVRSQGDGSKK
jgi:hypothetical protein